MGGIFDDVFDDDWGQDEDGKCNPVEDSKTDSWNTGSVVDTWSTDELWSSEENAEKEDELDSFNMSDYFD